jgi:hypothetical protein
MTISVVTVKDSFAGDDTDTDRTTVALYYGTSDLVIYEVVDDVASLLHAGVDYDAALSGELPSVATITPAAAIPTGTTWVAYRNQDDVQDTDYITGGNFAAASHEEALDKRAMRTADLAFHTPRTLRLHPTDEDGDMVLPRKAARLSNLLQFDSVTGLANVVSTDVLVPGSWAVGAYGEALLESATQAEGRALMPYPLGHISGFRMAWGSTTLGTMSIGSCRGADEVLNIDASATLRKTFNTTGDWAEGADGNIRPTAASLVADSWYGVFVIGKPDGTVDWGIDDEVDAANLLAAASGYTDYRRVGFVLTNSGATSWVPWFHIVEDDSVWFDVPIYEEFANFDAYTDIPDVLVTLAYTPPSVTAIVDLMFDATMGGALQVAPLGVALQAPINSDTPGVLVPFDPFNVRLEMPISVDHTFKISGQDTDFLLKTVVHGWRDRRLIA